MSRANEGPLIDQDDTSPSGPVNVWKNIMQLVDGARAPPPPASAVTSRQHELLPT